GQRGGAQRAGPRQRAELALSAERLIAAAWPDEQMSPPAALNRLHVALTTLRNLGLRDLLLRDGDGYLLAPDIALEVRPGPSVRPS
ncbi:MAG TPA: hypothetical protein PKU97_21075, partial [Kofleriaceae bacterium]|nr:hypothetical protein [Kofleriaceae bacterium]